MRLTSRSEYGLKALSVLARRWHNGHIEYVRLRDIASESGISWRYLEQVLVPLAYTGIVETKRGHHGGYRLQRPPQQVSLAEIIEVLEGQVTPIPTWTDAINRNSTLGKVLHDVQNAVGAILEHETLETLAVKPHVRLQSPTPVNGSGELEPAGHA